MGKNTIPLAYFNIIDKIRSLYESVHCAPSLPAKTTLVMLLLPWKAELVISRADKIILSDLSFCILELDNDGACSYKLQLAAGRRLLWVYMASVGVLVYWSRNGKEES